MASKLKQEKTARAELAKGYVIGALIILRKANGLSIAAAKGIVDGWVKQSKRRAERHKMKTPKQTVLETYPTARASKTARGTLFNWWIFPDHTGAFSIGAGRSASDAWANAALQLADRTSDKN